MRKINVNLFSRFQDSLKLDLSDGQVNSFHEGVQPVVDITPQIQDSVTGSDSATRPTAGAVTITFTVPDGYSYNFKSLSILGSIANNTLSIVFGSHQVYSSAGLTGWQNISCDYWGNSGESMIATISTTFGGGITGYFTFYGLQYRGVY